MNIDVMASVKEVNSHRIFKKNVVVIDVLRATSTIVTALANNAFSVIPVEHIEEARKIREDEKEGMILLGGEREAKIIDGFHFGNSPLSYMEDKVKDRKVVLTTTNGTRTIKACIGGENLYIASFLNVTAVIEKLIEYGKDIVIVCSGTDGQYSMDDALCAGMIISLINNMKNIITTDLGWTIKELYEAYKYDFHGLLKNCRHYKRLKENGFEEDLKYCLQTDIYDIVPIYREGSIQVLK
ncbi:2-phosphosulfolactate phosphatase [Maledivibacter halophilus]|uniref:Probable 2-phosphosulfolactate phosphatase n=1 Tax=Maledivibacter halophilus TaxID=36842 RepID=A0A1T5MUV0_9FIRM|nr:2-phosphosulfolactate phosphatase [Maledivibacter halophilus]SKC91773.1 2-phosphosulfolactate phosphatase [Maledivibacter halophilus]